MQRFLKGQDYPARKDDLLETARSNHAPDEVIRTIGDLSDEEFGGPQDVMKETAKKGERKKDKERNEGGMSVEPM